MIVRNNRRKRVLAPDGLEDCQFLKPLSTWILSGTARPGLRSRSPSGSQNFVESAASRPF